MRVAMLDGRAQYATLRGEILSAVDRVLASGQWIGGEEVRALEEELAPRFGCRHAVGVASGTDALVLSLRALGVGPDSEVVVPAFSFFATAGAVANVGARPIFADIEAGHFHIDPDSFAEMITDRTRAVIPVDLFGLCPDYEPIRRIADPRGIAVVEDAAQAIDADLGGRPAGSLGDLAAFSFYPTKNLGACGDGGMVSTNDSVLAEKVRRLAAHGARGGHLHEIIGTNSRLDPIQAAILRVKLRHLDAWHAARVRNAAFYTERFSGHPALVAPPEIPGRRHVFHQYVIRVVRGTRDALKDHLESRGIASAIYYPVPLHLQGCFADLGGRPGDLPVAEEAVRTCLALPVHPDLDRGSLETVVTQVLAWADGQI